VRRADERIHLHTGPTGEPKVIDLKPLYDPFKGQTCPGIYELDGDTLKLCLPNEPLAARPTELKAGAGSRLCLFTLKRSKP